jgi:Ras-related protein Rab-18
MGVHVHGDRKKKVYDVTNRASFEAIAWWFAERNKHAPKHAIKMIVGNKSDKGAKKNAIFFFFFFFFFLLIIITERGPLSSSKQCHMRQVSAAEGAAYAAKMGCLFVESSAKTAVGVRETFRDVVERIIHSF